MIKVVNLEETAKSTLVNLFSNRSIISTEKYLPIVQDILSNIKTNGDNALVKYTAQFDWSGITIDTLRVSDKEIENAYYELDEETKNLIRIAIKRVTKFHERQKQNSWFDTSESGVILGQITRPLATVGIYVPGGKASYPSSVIMNAIPAKTAGVNKIIMSTPVGKDGIVSPVILFAAKESGVDEIYRIGGAQAIAAMAYGTQTISRVDKIVGPGNIFVALAKKMVYGLVDIDMIAGPSEILVIADDSANPVFVAADLLSQAEHDEMAAAIMITTSKTLATKVKEEIKIQLNALPRKEIAEKSIKDYGLILVTNDIEQAFELSNLIAPEHLELCVKEPSIYLGKIKNAGAIFVGNFSPEPLGDYMAGPSHVLPTSGTAKFSSPLSVDHFYKKSSLVWFDEHSMKALGNDVIKFAQLEGLDAHANSIKVRME